jgi:hypothetical protein
MLFPYKIMAGLLALLNTLIIFIPANAFNPASVRFSVINNANRNYQIVVCDKGSYVSTYATETTNLNSTTESKLIASNVTTTVFGNSDAAVLKIKLFDTNAILSKTNTDCTNKSYIESDYEVTNKSLSVEITSVGTLVKKNSTANTLEIQNNANISAIVLFCSLDNVLYRELSSGESSVIPANSSKKYPISTSAKVYVFEWEQGTTINYTSDCKPLEKQTDMVLYYYPSTTSQKRTITPLKASLPIKTAEIKLIDNQQSNTSTFVQIKKQQTQTSKQSTIQVETKPIAQPKTTTVLKLIRTGGI